MKEKERYNEKNSELFNLKLKYNKLNKIKLEWLTQMKIVPVKYALNHMI